jgi:hypothetical protein
MRLSLSFFASATSMKRLAIKKSGWADCVSLPARPLNTATVALRFAAWQQRTARPVHDADGSINRRGFAGRTVIPGLCGECAHGRSRSAKTPVSITRVGRGTRAGLLGGARRGYPALTGHSGSCEGGCGDQRSRQKFKFGHSISPLDLKSQQRLASRWKWSSDRPITVTIPHLVSTAREVGGGMRPSIAGR